MASQDELVSLKGSRRQQTSTTEIQGDKSGKSSVCVACLTSIYSYIFEE